MSTDIEGNEELIDVLIEEELQLLEEGDLAGAGAVEKTLESMTGAEHEAEPETLVGQLMEETVMAIASGNMAVVDEVEAMLDAAMESEE